MLSSPNAVPAVGLSQKVELKQMFFFCPFCSHRETYCFPPFPVARTLICWRKALEHLDGGTVLLGISFVSVIPVASPCAPDGRGSPLRKGQLMEVTRAAGRRADKQGKGTPFSRHFQLPGRHHLSLKGQRSETKGIASALSCFIFLSKKDTSFCPLLSVSH